MNDSWLNHGVYPLLEMIGGFQSYFTRVCVWIAAICLLMSLLMMVVKIYLGVTNAREQIIKMGITFCIYIFMMFLYPIVMKSILPFAMNLGYGAVFGSSSAVTYDDRLDDAKNKADFYKWIGTNTGNIFTATEKNDPDGQKTQVYLDMNIISSETGYLDLNKFILYCIALLKIGFEAFPSISFWSFFSPSVFFSSFIYFLGVLVACVAMIISSINYLMCLIDYFALSGFGVLTIPLSLWDGTKSYTEKLFSSIGSIIIKLMIISAFMSLGSLTVIDFFVEMYTVLKPLGHLGIEDTFKLVELAISLIFRSFLLITLTINTEKIAGFINGGSPAMSIGEAAIGAGSTAIGVGLAAKGASGVVNARRSVGEAAVMGGAGAAFGFKTRNMGGSALRSGLSSATSSLARSAGGALQSAPGAIRQLATGMTQMTGLAKGGDRGFGGGIGNMGLKDNQTGSSSVSSGVNNDSSANNSNVGTSAYGASMPSLGGAESSSGGNLKNSQSNDFTNPNVTQAGGLQSETTDNQSCGLYGTVNTDAQGHSGSFSDSLIIHANNSQQSSMARQAGFFTGTTGNVIKSLNNARLEREAGNKIGNGRVSAVKRGLKAGVVGAAGSTVNAHGGLEVRFKSASAFAKVIGSTHANVKVNSASSVDKTIDCQKAVNPFDIRGK